ncbi:MAG: V-type ATP synthase subunit F [Sediminispirochaetaceae bacterium]
MKYFVIGGEDAVLGFGMVGVDGRIAGSQEDAEKAFSEALGDKDVGIIIITEQAASFIRSKVDTYLYSRSFPLIVEIPDRDGPMEGRLELREMVNRAIGINL